MKAGQTTNLYLSNVAILKDYGYKQKLALCSTLRKKGFEVDDDRHKNRGQVHDHKLEESISRARSRIFELAYCNHWEMWVTLTINPLKYDRHNLKAYYKDFSQWLRNYGKKHGIKIDYIFIPEMHEDGAWHMHGLMAGVPEGHLEENEHGYLDWKSYRDKFGYISIDNEIRNHEAVSKYMTKYITKDLSKSITDLNAKMYYCSTGLKRAEEIKRGTLATTNIPWDYSNEYVSIKWSEVDLSALILTGNE